LILFGFLQKEGEKPTHTHIEGASKREPLAPQKCRKNPTKLPIAFVSLVKFDQKM
jgi:hypothetical protein